MKTIACYIRVSTEEEDQALQRRDINRCIKKKRLNPKNVRWYIDKLDSDLNAFEKLQADISKRKVKTVIVWRLDRIAPKLRDGLSILGDWSKVPLRIVAVTQDVDFKGGPDNPIASILGGLAETANQYIREQTNKGLKVARARGRLGGRPPLSADDPKVLKAKKLHKAGRLSPDEIAERLGISKSTLYRYTEM